jgi:hypothetical protein
MVRRLIPVLALAALVLAACGSSTPALTDPKEIVTQGLAATADLNSFHFSLSVDGDVSMAELGGEMSLTGTSLEGDFDLDDGRAQLTFAVPSLLGLSGELILADEALFVRTSMTGEQWARMDASKASGDPVSAVMDPKELIAKVEEFLDTEGVELDKLDDVDCGDRSCYLVRLTVPASSLADAAAGASLVPGDVFGESLVLDLQFDRDESYLAGVSTSFAGDQGSLTLTLTISDFNEAVEVNPPPSDQVTDGLDGFPF